MPPDLDTLGDDVPPALVAIARRAVQLDAADRYPSAVELAEDLDRWLSGRRVSAHEYTPSELLARLVRAWRAPLAVGGLAVLLLGVVVAVAVKRTAGERASADANMSLALALQAQAAQQADRLPEAQVFAAHALALGPSPLARGVMAATASPPARRVERLELPEICQHRGYLSPDASRLACSGQGQLQVYAVPEMELVVQLEMNVVEVPQWLGDQLVIGNGDETLFMLDGEVVDRGPAGFVAFAAGARFHAASQVVVDPDGQARDVEICVAARTSVAELPDGLLVGCTDRRRMVWGPRGDVLFERAYDEEVTWASSAVVGGALYVGRVDGAVQRVDLAEIVGGPLLPGFEGSVGQLLPVPGTSLILAKGERGGPRIWNTTIHEWVGSLPAGVSVMSAGTETGEVWLLGETLDRWEFDPNPRPTVLDVTAGITKVALSPDGEQVAIGLGDASVVVRSLKDGAQVAGWTWGSGVAKCAAWVEGGVLGSTMGGGVAVLNDEGVHSGEPTFVARRCESFADNSGWGSGYSPGMFRIRGTELVIEHGTEGSVFFDVSASADRVWGAALDTEGSVWRSGGDGWSPLEVLHDAVAVDITNEGEVVYAHRRELCFKDTCQSIEDSILDVSVAGGQVAVGTLSGDVYLVELESLEIVAIMRGHTQRSASVEMGSDGTLVSGGWDGTVRIWDLRGLYTPAEQLVADNEAAWGLTLEDALRTR